MNLDPKQELAAGSLGKSLVVTAGAGSGKTRALVERYIRLITRPNGDGLTGPEGIVAITFTEKAAAEMRARVEKSLREKISCEPDASTAASLKGLLERLPQARISTVDSFCMNLVRNFPLYSKVSPQFSVLEEADASVLRMESLKLAISHELKDLDEVNGAEFTDRVTSLFGSLTSFLKLMEKGLLSFYTSGKRDFEGQVDPYSSIVMNIRRKAAEAYEEKLAGFKALDFSAIELKALELLRGKAGGEVRKGITHVMVDEYQDINSMQDHIVRCLAAEPGASAEEILKSGKLFIVGDAKQSIYGFRGAEPQIFDAWIEKANGLGLHVDLDTNYRSHPALIDLYNSLFAVIMEQRYTACNAGRSADVNEGKALVQVIDCAKEEKGRVFERTASEIIDVVLNWRGIDGDGKECRLGFKDIALLTPSNDGMDPYVEAFRRRGIPVVVSKSGGFFRSESASFIVNLLQAAMSEAEDVSAYQLLASPAYCISEATIAAMCSAGARLSTYLADPTSLQAGQFADDEERRRFERAVTAVSAVRRMRGSYDSRELLEKMAEEYGMEEDILSGYGRQGVANFRKLMEISSDRALGLGDPHKFLEYLRMMRDNGVASDEPDLLDDDEDAVKAMTVHKAKGLEFPVVILGNGNHLLEKDLRSDETKVISTADGRLLMEPEEGEEGYEDYQREKRYLQARRDEERKRLIYVALTRAKELLVISGVEATKTITKDDGSQQAKGKGTKKPQAKGSRLFQELMRLASGEDGCPRHLRIEVERDMESKSDVKVPEKATGPDTEHMGVDPVMMERANDRVTRFSPSSLMAFLDCPLDFLRAYWYRLPQEECPGDAGTVSAKNTYSSSDLGTIVHFIAQNSETEAEYEAAFSRAESAFGGKLTDNAALRRRVEELSRNYYKYFAGKQKPARLLKEVGFSMLISGYTLEGIIDRLEGDGNGSWKVIDLKTNNLGVREREELERKYEIQLMAYKLAASRAYSSDNVSADLLFLCDNTTVGIRERGLQAIERGLLDVIERAAKLPEECRSLAAACNKCEKRRTCSRKPAQFEDDYEIEGGFGDLERELV